jgi:hypothetical protein
VQSSNATDAKTYTKIDTPTNPEAYTKTNATTFSKAYASIAQKDLFCLGTLLW